MNINEYFSDKTIDLVLANPPYIPSNYQQTQIQQSNEMNEANTNETVNENEIKSENKIENEFENNSESNNNSNSNNVIDKSSLQGYGAGGFQGESVTIDITQFITKLVKQQKSTIILYFVANFMNVNMYSIKINEWIHKLHNNIVKINGFIWFGKKWTINEYTLLILQKQINLNDIIFSNYRNILINQNITDICNGISLLRFEYFQNVENSENSEIFELNKNENNIEIIASHEDLWQQLAMNNQTVVEQLYSKL